MFSVLIESETTPARRGQWLAGSAVLHSVIVAAAVAATVQQLEAGPDPGVPVSTLVFTRAAPATPATPRAFAPRGGGVPTTAAVPRFDVTIPAIALVDQATTFTLDPEALVANVLRAPGGLSGSAGDTAGIRSVRLPTEVDRAVVAHASNGAPRYPSALRAAGVEGEVLVRFVVDTLGRVERGSITIVRAAHDAFGEAVTGWLLRNRYQPAEIGGRPVRQLVEQRVDFDLKKH